MWLVEQQHGSARCDGIQRLRAREDVAAAPQHVTGLVEGVDRHHHELDMGRAYEVPQAMQPLSSVRKETNVQTRVERGEVVLGDLQGLEHPLANRDRGYDDDKLGPATTLRQLERTPDEHVGLARPRLHLDGKRCGQALAVTMIRDDVAALRTGLRTGRRIPSSFERLEDRFHGLTLVVERCVKAEFHGSLEWTS